MKKSYTLIEKLKEIVTSNPDQIAMQIKKTSGYETLTYQQFYDHAKIIAQALIATDIHPGERISIILENRMEWGQIYFGILMAGAIAVPLDPQATPQELKHFLEHSECKIIFTSAQLLASLEETLTQISSLQKIIALDFKKVNPDKIVSFDSLRNEKRQHQELPKISENDLASILYTSGTTGNPKGVMLSHKNFYSDFACVQAMKTLSGNHNFLAILPLHHSFPFMATLLYPLFAKNKITYLSSLKQKDIFDCISEAKITILIGVPQLFSLMAQSIRHEMEKISFFIRLPLNAAIETLWMTRKLTGMNLTKSLLKKIHAKFGKQFKYLASGGAKFNTEDELLLNKIGFTFIQGYGLTETSPAVTFNPIQNPRIGSAGKVMPNIEIRIENNGETNSGEVVIRGPNVMQGYYKNNKETEAVLKEGWFYSGDLGYFDKDDYLFLTGRKKEVIVLSNGKNIYPNEVETFYGESVYIKELCVLPVAEGDTEKLMAVIVPDFDYFKKINELDIDFTIRWDIENFSRKYPSYKRIMGYILTKHELPKTRLGKLKRYEIREKYLDNLLGKETSKEEYLPTEDELQLLASTTFNDVCELLETEYNAKTPIQLNDHLEIDLGFDSLKRAELISSLENHFNIKISEQEFITLYSVKDVVREINKIIEQGECPPAIQKEARTKTPPWREILNSNPSKILLDKIELKPSNLSKFISMITTYSLWLFFKFFFKLKTNGIKNLPEEGPYILCANHTSFLDAFFIASSLPKNLLFQTFALGYTGYFEAPIIKHVVKVWRIIPIDPNARLIDAMQATSLVLRHKKIACIFPEARRSIDGTLQSFKQGVGIIAKELNIPLVPVYIKGAFEAWPRTKRFPRPHPIELYYGKPQEPSVLMKIGYEKDAKTDYEAITLGLREKIESLSQAANHHQ